MRVLITGATGLIGTHVAELLAGKVEVHVVSRSDASSDDPSVTRWKADLTLPGTARELVRSIKPNVVCHLAGLANGARSIDALLPTLSANLVVTVEILDAVTRLGCDRLVVAGSLLEEPTDASSTGFPSSPYGASRAASSAYSRMCHALFDTHVVVLRPSYVYGPRQSDSSKLLPHVIQAFLQDTSPDLGSGERRLDWLYAADAAEAFCAALTAPGVDGETIDLVSGYRHTVREVVEKVHALIGPPNARPLFGAQTTRPFEQDVPGDPSLARRQLDWQARTDLNEGLSRTVAWFNQVADSGE